MPRERLCRVCGGWHDPEAWPHNCTEWEPPMQFLAAPRVQGDTMGHVQSMVDGRWYDSKSALRKGYRAAGVQEVGNEVPTARRKPTRAEVEKRDRERYGALARAMSRVGLGAP